MTTVRKCYDKHCRFWLKGNECNLKEIIIDFFHCCQKENRKNKMRFFIKNKKNKKLKLKEGAY
jgi:hypothetical protein